MLHPHNLFKLQDVFEDCDFSNDVEKKTLTLTLLLLLLLSRTFYQYRCENPVCSNLKKIYIFVLIIPPSNEKNNNFLKKNIEKQQTPILTVIQKSTFCSKKYK